MCSVSLMQMTDKPSLPGKASSPSHWPEKVTSESHYKLQCFYLSRSLDDGDDDWRMSQIEADNLSTVINEILASYDPRLRPYAGGKFAWMSRWG